MKTLLALIAVSFFVFNAASARAWCPTGYYMASDGNCYVGTYNAPGLYISPPSIDFSFGFGGNGGYHGERHDGGFHGGREGFHGGGHR